MSEEVKPETQVTPCIKPMTSAATPMGINTCPTIKDIKLKKFGFSMRDLRISSNGKPSRLQEKKNKLGLSKLSSSSQSQFGSEAVSWYRTKQEADDIILEEN